MTEIVTLHPKDPEPSFLCGVEFYRKPDGSIHAKLMEMDGDLIETTGDDVASRMEIIADWIRQGAQSMSEQAKAFLGET